MVITAISLLFTLMLGIIIRLVINKNSLKDDHERIQDCFDALAMQHEKIKAMYEMERNTTTRLGFYSIAYFELLTENKNINSMLDEYIERDFDRAKKSKKK
jgi:hypothetical protein